MIVRPVARIVLAFAVGRTFFGLLFLVSVVEHWTLPWYLPLEHRWVLASSVRTVGMDWYGRSGLALVGGLLAGLATYALGGVSRLAPRLSRPAFVLGITRLGALLLLVDFVFYTLSLLTRVVHPIPAPSWYCPR